jgi:hypothetical protein
VRRYGEDARASHTELSISSVFLMLGGAPTSNQSP